MKPIVTIEFKSLGELRAALDFCADVVSNRAGSDAAQNMDVVFTESSKTKRVRLFEENHEFNVGVSG